MYYDVNNINLSLISSLKSQFEDENGYFINSVYNEFKSCYMKNCSDEFIKIMSLKLENMYNELDDCYKSISSWWNEYCLNGEGIESYCSCNSRIGQIPSGTIRNYISYKLPTLEEKINYFD